MAGWMASSMKFPKIVQNLAQAGSVNDWGSQKLCKIRRCPKKSANFFQRTGYFEPIFLQLDQRTKFGYYVKFVCAEQFVHTAH